MLWQWRGKRLTSAALATLTRLRDLLSGDLATELGGWLTPAEVAATIRRVELLLAHKVHPLAAGRLAGGAVAADLVAAHVVVSDRGLAEAAAGALATAVLAPVAATAQVTLELPGDRVAAGLRQVGRVLGLLEAAHVLGHVAVLLG